MGGMLSTQMLGNWPFACGPAAQNSETVRVALSCGRVKGGQPLRRPACGFV